MQPVETAAPRQAPTPHLTARMDSLEHRIGSIEGFIREIIERGGAGPEGAPVIPADYTTDQAGALLGRSAFTVREYCRLGKVRASKRPPRLGGKPEWIIAGAELDRVRADGLLPIDLGRNAG